MSDTDHATTDKITELSTQISTLSGKLGQLAEFLKHDIESSVKQISAQSDFNNGLFNIVKIQQARIEKLNKSIVALSLFSVITFAVAAATLACTILYP